MRRQGRLELFLVLPDGSKSLIPAEWTDLAPESMQTSEQTATLATVRQLLHARAVIDALLSRSQEGQSDR